MIQARSAKILLILRPLAIASIASLLTIHLVSAQSGPEAITQGNTTVANGSTFIVDIVVSSPPSSPVGVAQVYLEFDENYLQVVSGSHPSGPLIPGPVFDATWEDVILNTADNGAGKASFVGGKGRTGNDAQGDFVLAQVQFHAIAETPPLAGTDLKFIIAVPQRTRVVSGITDVTSTVFGTTLHVVNNAAPVAGNDAYSVIQGATLDVDAGNGVLANDADPDGGR